MSAPQCPPLALDAELAAMIERYRAAKAAGAAASKAATEVEKVGHYDKDMPMQPRRANESGPTANERLAAIALADRLLLWVGESRKV